MWETWIRFLGQEDPLEKEMATHSSILAWRIPWLEEPGGLQSTESQTVGHHWATWLHFKHLSRLYSCTQQERRGERLCLPHLIQRHRVRSELPIQMALQDSSTRHSRNNFTLNQVNPGYRERGCTPNSFFEVKFHVKIWQGKRKENYRLILTHQHKCKIHY